MNFLNSALTLDYFPTPHTRTNSKWIKDLNMRPESIKLLEEIRQYRLTNLSYQYFLDMSPQVRETKRDCIKLKSSLQDFPGGPVVKNLSSNAGDAGSTPGRGTKIPHVMGQLSPHATAAEPAHLN